MGKQFVTRSRGEWEILASQEVQETRGLRSRATVWLRGMLQRFDQGGPESAITLAVPDRFWEALGPAMVTNAQPDESQD